MSRPWMPLYIADYLAGTAHLNAAEHGAYLLLIMHYWSKGGLPDNEETIRRITRMTTRQWSQSRDILRSLFDDGWKHRRIDAELAKAVEISQVNSANARKSHEKRKKSATDPQVRSHTQSQSQSPIDAVADTRAREGSAVSREAFDLADRVMKAQGLDREDPRCIGAAYTCQAWITGGWQPDLIVTTIERVMVKRTKPPGSLRYFENAIADAHADLARMLPQGQPTGPPRPAARRTYLDIVHDIDRQLSHEPDRTDHAGPVIDA